MYNTLKIIFSFLFVALICTSCRTELDDAAIDTANWKEFMVAKYNGCDVVCFVREVERIIAPPYGDCVVFEILYFVKNNGLKMGDYVKMSYWSELMSNESFIHSWNGNFAPGRTGFIFLNKEYLKRDEQSRNSRSVYIHDDNILEFFELSNSGPGHVFWLYLDEIGWRKKNIDYKFQGL